jgi:hypothetical protein
VRDQVSHPYRITGKIILLYTLIFVLLDSHLEDKRTTQLIVVLSQFCEKQLKMRDELRTYKIDEIGNYKHICYMRSSEEDTCHMTVAVQRSHKQLCIKLTNETRLSSEKRKYIGVQLRNSDLFDRRTSIHSTSKILRLYEVKLVHTQTLHGAFILNNHSVQGNMETYF